MSTAQNKEINLIPKEKWETGVLGKILKWALNVGRYVVVFTELVVIGAFLYRFDLDRQLTDLHEEINQRTRVLASYEDLETKFRRLQAQLKLVKESEVSGVDTSKILAGISQITPLDTVYKTITMAPNKINLEGETLSDAGLATLLVRAQESPLFEEVSLENITSTGKQGQMIEFRLSLSLKKGK
jgi:Tfp pilus assembly protein PilN